jgi:hypothetical protein
MGVFNPPAHLSVEDFERKFEAFIDAFLALPVARKTIIKYELVCILDWFPPFTTHASLPVLFAR